MKKVFLFTVSVLCALVITSCSLGSKPQEFKSEAGKFSVMVPGTMKEEVQSVDTQAGAIELHLFTSDQGNVAYIVGYADYPAELIQMADVETLLDGSRDGAVGNVGGTITSEAKITIDGNSGRDLVIGAKVDEKDATIRLRIYLVENRLYQVMAIAETSKASAPDMTTYLDSFKLLK